MKEYEAFNYCPMCGEKSELDIFEDHKNRKCTKCGFVMYLNPKPCASAMILKNNKILLTKRAREPHKGRWEIPGGFLSEGESLEIALKREMKEELGIKIKNLKYFDSKRGHYKVGELDYNLIISYFTCKYTGTIKTNYEISEYGFFELDKLPDVCFESHQKILKKLKSKLN